MNIFIERFIKDLIIANVVIYVLENSITKLSFFYGFVISIVSIVLVRMLAIIVKSLKNKYN